MLLPSAPAATGLFPAAVSQSPPVGLSWFTRKLYSERITPMVARILGSEGSERVVVECLTRVDAKVFGTDLFLKVVQANASVIVTEYEPISLEVASIEPFLPIGEGSIKDQLIDLIKGDKLPNSVPLMLGTTRDEG